MKRTVTAHLELYLHGEADLIFSIAVAQGQDVTESLQISSNGVQLDPHEIIGRHGTRLHRLTGPVGPMVIDYSAEVRGQADAPPVEELDIIEYRRPSRYCESDTLFATARSEFAGVQGKELLDAVSTWVGDRLRYVAGASQPTDGAVATMLARRGVCRDYAHLVVALLRALDVPARLAAVYAPGLAPMDFHAVAEAFVEGAWQVVDATALAPRSSLLRIATGQDASETAFLSQHGAAVDLRWMAVTAVVDELPGDDLTQLVTLR
ncbi:transglutaminase-like domain-containing protein [Aeromicrobium wangtongii]|uniref:Transglutaminase domain-containing protein n=1 Tax=Aeromicrobium wangtongii TaxID=2969247 RepID=A0ABY5M821_9ACTN|nr:transglutaminase domain-containing protein [Aeromicrobium wangtongii]MCD9196785.1 transglutaminase domain-containing protein [Aeromicrobium wangtongii]UUP14295.1 transglutaminase domain-containing protein [Aeromicrobium wangtongii]